VPELLAAHRGAEVVLRNSHVHGRQDRRGVHRLQAGLPVARSEARIANDKDARKTETLLADAGLSIGEIATLLGKKYETVKTTLRRSRPEKAKAA
jgi:DNA-directed RNA polymerase specialized sigma24 family protein